MEPEGKCIMQTGLYSYCLSDTVGQLVGGFGSEQSSILVQKTDNNQKKEKQSLDLCIGMRSVALLTGTLSKLTYDP